MNGSSYPRVTVACATCGHVKVTPDAVTIRHCTDIEQWSYWFVCPHCGMRAAGSTSASAGLAAIEAGSHLNMWTLPAELNERPQGRSLTLVDLLELRLLLVEPDWIEQLL